MALIVLSLWSITTIPAEAQTFTPIDPSSLPYVITQPGEYRLTGDVIDSSLGIAITVLSSDVVIDGQGYKLDGVDSGSTYAIRVVQGGSSFRNVHIKNMVVTDWNFGVDVERSSVLIEDVSFTSNRVGVRSQYTDPWNEGLTITGCTMSDGLWGFLTQHTSYNTLTDNVIERNQYYGIWMTYGASHNLIEGNGIRYNKRNGIVLGEGSGDISQGNIIRGNDIRSNGLNGYVSLWGYQVWNGGIYLAGTQDNEIVGNTFTYNRKYGVYLYKSSDITVEDNIFDYGAEGLTLDASADYWSSVPGSLIENNTFTNLQYGVHLIGEYGSNRNVIRNNTATDNTYGIHATGSYLTIEDNVVNENTYGMYLSASRSTIANNTVNSNTESGITFDSMFYTDVINNTANYNGKSGIILKEMDDTGSYYGTLINNTACYNHGTASFYGPIEGGIVIWNNKIKGLYLTVEGNVAEWNDGAGIILAGFRRINVRNNTLESNQIGLRLLTCMGNSVSVNRIRDNSLYGISYFYLQSSSYPFTPITFYDNYLSNTQNVYYDREAYSCFYANVWSVASAPGPNIVGGPNLGGNYWANPSGTGFSEVTPDGDGDGFCDAVYPVMAGNIDSLPLSYGYQAPQIDAFSPVSPFVMDEGDTQVFSVSASDPNGDSLSYYWALDGSPVGDDSPGYSFSPGYYDSGVYGLSCTVSDGIYSAVQAWVITVNDVPDIDGDGIYNAVDASPMVFSDDFNDHGIGGVTSGVVLSRGDQLLTVSEEPNPDGVRVSADMAGGLAPALLSISGGAFVSLDAGDEVIVTQGSVTLFVVSGVVEVTYTADDGSVALASLSEGDHITFDGSDFSFTNLGRGEVTVYVNDVPYSIPGGETVILNLPPVADAGGPYLGDEGAPVVFDGSGFDDDGVVVGYHWIFGDGVGTSDLEDPVYVYMSDGVYTATLTVTDDLGAVGVDTVIVTVVDLAPRAGFTWSHMPQDEGLAVQFTDDSVSSPDVVVAWSWDFAGLGTSIVQNPSFTFLDDGVYAVTLTVTDEDGSIDSIAHSVTIVDLVPIAEFSWSPEPQSEGSPVQFNDESVSSPDAVVAWSWDFAGLGTSIVQNPSFTFMDDGVYAVTLTVTDDDGSIASVMHVVTVMDLDPVVDFMWAPVSQYEGSLVQFTDASTSAPDGVVGWSWDFAGLGSSDVQNPSFTFMDDGIYAVTLTVTDDDSDASLTRMVSILDKAPVAAVSGDVVLDEGSVGSYDAGGSTSAPDMIIGYEWDWDYSGVFTPSGDTGVAQSHTWMDDGPYTVAVRVTDEDGSTDIATMRVSVADLSPVAGFDGWDVLWDEGMIDSFFDVSFSYPDDLVDWDWDFGDSVTGSGPNPSHKYSEDGVYTVTLTVTDEDGSVDSVVHSVTVLDVDPVADFGWEASKALEGTVLPFFDYSHGVPDDMLTDWVWDFGDGTGASGSSVSHVYADNGVYTVSLTVYDEDSSSSVSKSVRIGNIAPFIDEAASSVVSPIDEGSSTTLVGVFKDPGVDDTHMAVVDWGDGASTNPPVIGDPGDGSVTADHLYLDDGVYKVSLTVTDKDGDEGVLKLPVVVNNVAPTVAVAGPESGFEGDTLEFTGVFSDPGVLDSHELIWDFGDGETISDPSGEDLVVQHTYGDNGVYLVSLTVVDDDVGVGVATMFVEVFNVAPVVVAGPSQTGMMGEPVYVSATYSDPGWLDTHVAVIDWGDGESSSMSVSGGVVEASHVYGAGAEYTVTITVVDDDGGSGFDTLVVKLSPRCMKLEAISLLEDALGVYGKHVEHDIEQAIWHIEKSLDEDLWLDEIHLVWRHGNKVFDEEKLAVKELLHIVEWKDAPDEAVELAYSVIDMLVEADRWLADIQYTDALVFAGTHKQVDHQLALALKEFGNFEAELLTLKKDHSKYDDAINALNKAWQHAGLAIQHATK